MRADIITLLPEVFDNVFNESVLGSAIRNGLIEVVMHHFRLYGLGRHRMVDDTPYGGGPGMLLKPEPLVDCIRDVRKAGALAPVIGLTPQGIPLTQDLVKELACYDRVIFVCGRYEGFDERIIPEFDLQISVGDYVLTGGEIAVMTLIDAMSRMIPGTVGSMESVEQDSFYNGTLDHPQYTRPATWEHRKVPNVLAEGNHSYIEQFRRSASLVSTALNRPDVFKKLNITDKDKELLQELLLKLPK